MTKNSYSKLTVIAIIFLILWKVSVIGVSTTIPFWNISMEEDDVLNYDGVRIVLFFQPDCSQCHNQIITLKQIDEDFNITFIALSATKEDTNSSLLDFKSEHSISESWILGYASPSAISTFDLEVVPSQVILDDEDQIVSVMHGYFSYDAIEQKIDDAINHRTENYDTDPISDSGDLLTALFIIVGVGVGTIVVIFLIRSLKKGDKTADILIASKKIESEEQNNKK